MKTCVSFPTRLDRRLKKQNCWRAKRWRAGEASSSASSGAKRITPSECHIPKWSSPSECGGWGCCRLSLGRRGRRLATQVVAYLSHMEGHGPRRCFTCGAGGVCQLCDLCESVTCTVKCMLG